jgi:surface protein
MGILKTITEEYFGNIIREEDEINIDGLDVEIVSFTDNNGKKHGRGYKPKDIDTLKELLERMIEVRGDEGDFNDIDTSDITSMQYLFNYNSTFNGDITGWNVSSVRYMNYMFSNASSFNQPIGNWEFPNVENMRGMFCDATSFNQPIGDWEFPNVTDVSYMFYGAASFDQDLSKWDLKGKEKDKIFDGCPIKDEYKPKM